MTLAVLLLIAASWTGSPPSFQAANALPEVPDNPAAAQSAPPAAPAPLQKQDQSEASTPQNTPTAEQPSSPPAKSKKSTATKKIHHKKKAAQPNCGSEPSPTTTNSNSSPTPPSDPSGNQPQNSGPPAAPKNCPPTKIIVRQGGTTEPSIQLAGGPSADQAARQRDVVNQLLGVTDANLKRIAERQLSSTQQDTIGQIRSYEQQSRSAASEGDLDRARTLAWKAELLSEDLMKPAK